MTNTNIIYYCLSSADLRQPQLTMAELARGSSLQCTASLLCLGIVWELTGAMRKRGPVPPSSSELTLASSHGGWRSLRVGRGATLPQTCIPTGTASVLPLSIDQRKSQGHPRFEWTKNFALMGGAMKTHCKWAGRGEELQLPLQFVTHITKEWGTGTLTAGWQPSL